MAILERVERDLEAILGEKALNAAELRMMEEAQRQTLLLRQQALAPRNELAWEERGAVLAPLGSMERAFFLIDRIDAERRSVPAHHCRR